MQTRVLKNVIIGLGGQIIISVLGIIAPRLLITCYGSDANGLLGTITQIFVYMALLESGIGQAARNSLYKSIVNNNRDEISYIVSTAQYQFRRITIYYGVGVALLSVILPVVLKSELDYWTIFFLVFVQGVANVLSFYFIQTQTIVLSAYGKGYINNAINTVGQVLNYSVRIILAGMGVNIIFLQIAHLVFAIMKIAIYKWYFAKRYAWLNYKRAPKDAKLKDRNAYIVSEVAWVLFSTTDMIILSVLVSTQMSSVYSVYNLVFAGIGALLSAVYNSVSYILGQSYQKGIGYYAKIHDAFTTIYLGTMTALMCVAYILIIPFVKLYTAGVTDINYIYPEIPVLFCLLQMMASNFYVTENLSGLAGYAKQTCIVSVAATAVNLVLSALLASKFGIMGVVGATVIASPIKIIYGLYIADKKVLKRTHTQPIKTMGVNYLFFAVVVLITPHIRLDINNYGEFILWGILITLICAIIGAVLNVIANPRCIELIISKNRKVFALNEEKGSMRNEKK